MNPKLEDILNETELDKILKWQKPNDKLIETIEDEKDQEPRLVRRESDRARRPQAGLAPELLRY